MASAPACALLKKSMNRCISERFPAGYNGLRNERRYAYNATHNVSTYRDGRNVLTNFSRDGVGRVTQKDYTVPESLQSLVPAVPTVTYGWNKNGQQ